MEALREFTIPVHGLGLGGHEFQHVVDWQFFQHFENSPVQQGRFEISVIFFKETDHWILTVEVSGVADTECDRCLAPISLPVSGRHVLVVKFGDERPADEDDPDVIYVPRETHHWNIAQYIFEFILLSIPVKKVYDCEDESVPPCDKEMLSRLEQEELEEKEEGNPVWDVLKGKNWNN